MSTRLEDQQADIIGRFACHNTSAIEFVVEAGQAIIAERLARNDRAFVANRQGVFVEIDMSSPPTAGGHPTVSLNERRQG